MIKNFSMHILILNSGQNGNFTLNDFSKLQTEGRDTLKNNKEKYGSRNFKTSIIDNRFISIYIEIGKTKPYSKTVFNIETEKEYQNPKKDHEIEPNNKFFALIDTERQMIFISNWTTMKSFFGNWLSDKIKAELCIKSILKEEEFLDKIKKINEISFFISRNQNLFNKNSQEVLSEKLREDLLGYEADSAKLTLKYNHKRMDKCLKSRLKNLLTEKEGFNNISIIGKSEENFERIFNLTEVISKIEINVDESKERELEPEEIFRELVSQIKQKNYENT